MPAESVSGWIVFKTFSGFLLTIFDKADRETEAKLSFGISNVVEVATFLVDLYIF